MISLNRRNGKPKLFVFSLTHGLYRRVFGVQRDWDAIWVNDRFTIMGFRNIPFCVLGEPWEQKPGTWSMIFEEQMIGCLSYQVIVEET